MTIKGKAILHSGTKGGSGSGNFGHGGRPGKLGGSIPKGAGGAGSAFEPQPVEMSRAEAVQTVKTAFSQAGVSGKSFRQALSGSIGGGDIHITRYVGQSVADVKAAHAKVDQALTEITGIKADANGTRQFGNQFIRLYSGQTGSNIQFDAMIRSAKQKVSW